MFGKEGLHLVSGILALILAACSQDQPSGDYEGDGAGATAKTDQLPHEAIARPSLAACGPCHEQVYLEWSQSLHASAWRERNARNATRNFARQECRPCHAPRPVLISGVDRQALSREVNQEDGVHCLSCHGREDGVAAARTISTAPCRPRFDARLLADALCYPCHGPRQGTFAEFARSDASALGIRCVDCHMPPRRDRPGRNHAGLGGLNELFVRRALHWSGVIAGGEVRVTLRNRTPHKLPAESASRALIVRVDFPDGTRTYRTLRRPGSSEPGEDTRLGPEERRTLRFALPSGAERASVQVLFKSFPLMPDGAAFDLGSVHLVCPASGGGEDR